jgi:hypothetical protein
MTSRKITSKLKSTRHDQAWWKEVGEVRYPTLAYVAYNLFAMPGISAECEHAFS